MACREYEDGLKELAAGPDRIGAGGLEPTREACVRAHLAGCAACREALEMEAQLYAAVDAALREEMNAEVPVALAARIRVAAAEEPKRLRANWWRWAAVAGSAAVAVMMLATVLRRAETPSVRRNEPDRAAAAVGAKPLLSATSSAAPSMRGGRPLVGHTTKRGVTRRTLGSPDVLILVEEQVAFARFAQSLRVDRDSARGVLGDGEESLAKPIQITPMEMAKLGVKPLEAGGSEQ